MVQQLRFIEEAKKLIDRIETTQTESLHKAAELYANAIANDGLVHLYGNGHSAIAVYETFPRIGSIVGFHPLLELSLTYYANVVGPNGLRQNQYLEQLEGFAEKILSNYDFGPHDVMVCFSSTGINQVVIEMAYGAKKRGIPVIAVTSVAHQSSTESRHSSGKRLSEIADVTIDNCTPPGDAMIHLDGCDAPVSPGSTLAAVTIVQTLNALTAEKLVERGCKPLILPSMHFKGDTSVDETIDAYYSETKRRFRKTR
ncbi:SIS domain-containing protein [Paenibacillus hodogayensis]|uniref:SIS domain-containing protein n=1 Tax=Paenibacillus hodogayensis TaxID=279208 RepID=A0ABV5VYS4_9BACL